MREQKQIYVFISNEAGMYYKAVQNIDGSYSITLNNANSPFPLKFNPSNLLDSALEFATNKKYFSLARSINYPLSFVKDGAAILNYLYTLGKGTEQKVIITIIEWNGNLGYYELSYKGEADMTEKSYDPQKGMFTVPLLDASAWGIISQTDEIQYAIDCSVSNPKAVRVLLDGITLVNTAAFQTIDNSIVKGSGIVNYFTQILGMALVNQTGDSFGVILQSQSLTSILSNAPDREAYYKAGLGAFYKSLYPTTIQVEGRLKFKTPVSYPNNNLRYTITIDTWKHFHGTSLYIIFDQQFVQPNTIYDIPFNFSIPLEANEAAYLVLQNVSQNISDTWGTILSTTISVSLKTRQEAAIAYGLRSLDLLQAIVDKQTDGKYTVRSNYYTINDNIVCMSGESIRGVQNAMIYSSFEDWFKSYDSLHYIAMRNINGEIWIEPAKEVYKQTSTIFDLGEVVSLKLTPANEYLFNQIVIGSPKQDYRHPSGRLEFNSENSYSLNILKSDKKINAVSVYRDDCYGIQFLLLDYKGNSSQDNIGDKSVFRVEISNQQGFAIDDVENFENVTVNSNPLEPLIRSPYQNDIITNDRPNVNGVAPAGSNVNVYVDGVLDGSTSSDSLGFWTYDIVNHLTTYNPPTHDGLHTIEVTYTDLSAPFDSVVVTIDTAVPTPVKIIYPQQNNSLYNNKPIIEGVAQAGTNINIFIDGAFVGNTVSNNSCKWEFQSPILTNTVHTILANTDSIVVSVDTAVAFPLITSFRKGYIEVNNLPLIEGVAKPNTLVNIWLNYISYSALGTAMSDANGNWSYQVVPINYIDPNGTVLVLAPIKNGLNVISTDLAVHIVGIQTTGYKLNRPPFSSILGVPDNTVFNVNLSPRRRLLNRAPLLASVLNKMQNEKIYLQKPDKNADLTTILNGVTISERDEVGYGDLGQPLFLLEDAEIRTKVPMSFNSILYNFNQGGIIQFSFKGSTLYALPIGSMKVKNVSSDVQDWKLLLSPKTTYQTLLNIYRNGTKIQLMQNSIYHSDYNSLHFVAYDFQKSQAYENYTIYQEWFNNRNKAWVNNPEYIQKFQKTDPIVDQIITRNLSDVKLLMYDCRKAVLGSASAGLIATILYAPVSAPPIPSPDIVLEAVIDFSLYPEGQYFFVMQVGTINVMISERIELKVKWKNSIYIEATNSVNMTGVFFNTGFITKIRVEGLIKKIQPKVTKNVANFENGDNELLFSLSSRKRDIRFGNAYGLPDYLYSKVALALGLDNLQIEGVYYVLADNEEIKPSEDIPGHPLYYYNVNLDLKTNQTGSYSDGIGPAGDRSSVVIVVDATAFGLSVGSLVSINLG